MNMQYNMGMYGSEMDYKQQVVAVGTPLPTSSLPIGKLPLHVNSYLFCYSMQ